MRHPIALSKMNILRNKHQTCSGLGCLFLFIDFVNKYLLFESPAAAEVLHIQDVKNELDIATYDNLGNLSLDALERVYRGCKEWQKELILNKFINESAKGNMAYYKPEKLSLLEKMKNEEIPTIVWNDKKKQEEQSYVYNINDKITKTREVLSSK